MLAGWRAKIVKRGLLASQIAHPASASRVPATVTQHVLRRLVGGADRLILVGVERPEADDRVAGHVGGFVGHPRPEVRRDLLALLRALVLVHVGDRLADALVRPP